MLPDIITTLMLLTNSAAQPRDVAIVPTVIASKNLSLNDRYGNEFVNTVFKDNILLTLNYMNGRVTKPADIDWSKIESEASYEFTLKPGESFAFHDQVLTDKAPNLVQTTKSTFSYDQGFKSDGYLMGDGVCHLASLMYWAAKQANLQALAPTNHDFAVIPDVPREFGVAIYDNPVDHTGQMTNLYITNNKDRAIKFIFENKNNNLNLKIEEL